jgi:hypothetical protein
MTIQQIAMRLVELCRTGKNEQAVEDLFADDAESIELVDMPGSPRVITGKAAILNKGHVWNAMHEVHSGTVSDAVMSDPSATSGYFAVSMSVDVTIKASKRRMQMNEIALYAVKNSKIASEQFFYAMG